MNERRGLLKLTSLQKCVKVAGLWLAHVTRRSSIVGDFITKIKGLRIINNIM